MDDLRLLVTSRVDLNLRGEHVLDLPPLPVPAAELENDVRALWCVPSVALILERADAASRPLQLTSAPLGVTGRVALRSAERSYSAASTSVSRVEDRQATDRGDAQQVRICRNHGIDASGQGCCQVDGIVAAESVLLRKVARVIRDGSDRLPDVGAGAAL